MPNKKTAPPPLCSAENADGLHAQARCLQHGWDGQKCLVHTRPATDGCGRILLTAQYLDVRGVDCFDGLQASISADGGISWTGFAPCDSLRSAESATQRLVACDMTPFYHRKTGCFLVIGHTAAYHPGSLQLIQQNGQEYRSTVYAVFDARMGTFGPLKLLPMPDPVRFANCGSGCCQCVEAENGDLLIPVYFGIVHDGPGQHYRTAVLRCGFDGQELSVLQIGNELDVAAESRGVYESSLTAFAGKYLLTLRADSCGYICDSADGLHFSAPKVWRYSDGEAVPTYNTQSHWATFGDALYLVYTCRDGNNDHVFRHRAPLYAAKVDPASLALQKKTEFAITPERGARLGNFGVCSDGGDRCIVTASEWMQPAGCEAYGSDNALWYVTLRRQHMF